MNIAKQKFSLNVVDVISTVLTTEAINFIAQKTLYNFSLEAIKLGKILLSNTNYFEKKKADFLF